MTDLPPDPDSAEDTGDDTGTPRWVKVFGIIALVVVLLFVILMLTRGAGGHGPGRHRLSRSPGLQSSPARITDHGMHLP